MGCGSSSAIIENNEKPKEEKEENNNFYESKEKQIAIKKVTEKQNEIIEKFHKKKGNSKNVGLSNISSCYIKFWNSNKGIKYTAESNAENVLNFLENINPFNEEIKKNKDINNLQTELNETEMYYSNIIKSNSPKSQNLQIKSTQKIHNNYNLTLKLKNLRTNQSKIFDFNNLDKPIVIIFFNILSEKALNKITEFKMKEIELLNQEDKNFILLPIINIFVEQFENVCNSKKYKRILEIIKENNENIKEDERDYFVLIKKVNDHFTQLFQLEKMKQSKCIIINRNSEISLILDEKIEFLNFEIIDFFLNTRNSEFSKDFFSFENKQHIIDILDKNCKEVCDKFYKKFKFEIDLKVISFEKKLPVFLRFTYHEKDKEIGEQLYKRVTENIKNKVNKMFYSQYIIKNNRNEIIEMVKYLKNKLDKDIFTFKKKEENNSYFSFILNSKISIINDINNNCNNTNNNDICKNKKYLLNYYIEQPLYISEILSLFSLNLEKTPKYSNLNCKYQVFPLKGTKLKPIIPKCKDIILTKESSKQKSNLDTNNVESDFDLQKNNIEVILLIESNILNFQQERNKILIILEALYNNDIKFVICIFGENEYDAQKLNDLSWNKFYFNEKKELFKIIFINKSLYENFYSFCFYSKESFFKIFRLNNEFNIIEIYNIDMYDTNHFSLSSIKNRNIFNFLLYISKKENLDINDNNIPLNNENDYKRFKENKKMIYEILSNNEIINKTNNNILLTDININFSYKKFYIIPEKNISYNLQKKYSNVNLSITYLDNISSQNFEELKKLINDNNINSSGKSSSIYIKLKEEKIETINIFENMETVFECPKCNRSYTFEKNSFYFCNNCKEKSVFCEECYRGFYDSVKIKKKMKNKISQENVFHEHHLILFYNYNPNKSSYILKEEYTKYMDIIENNKLKKICKLNCSICSSSNNLLNSNILISHIKKKKSENLNNNENNEIIICNKCFKLKNFTNTILEETSDNNIIIL